MRIAYLHQYFATPEQDSTGTRSYEFARRLANKGHEVHVISSSRNRTRSFTWKESSISGFKVHHIGIPYDNGMGFKRRIAAFAEFAIRAAGRARAVLPDVVFATSTPLTIALPAIYTSRSLGVPFVLEVRDLWPEIPIAIGALSDPMSIAAARRLELLAYSYANHIVALSPGMREGVIAAGVVPQRVSVIPNACDFDVFDCPAAAGERVRSEHEWLGSRPLVLYLGSVARANGVDYLVRVAALCREVDPEVRFCVIGAGACFRSVQDLAQRIGVLNKNFFMLPAIPKTNAACWLSAADLSCSLVIDLREMWNNSANKVFDSFAAGRPVAINHSGWQAALLTENNAGVVLPSVPERLDPRWFCALMRDRPRLSAMGQAARTLGRQQFARDKLAERMESILLDAYYASPSARPGRRRRIISLAVGGVLGRVR